MIVSFISWILDKPVDRIIGLLNCAICLMSGIFVHSPDPILNAGTLISSKKSAAFLENGVEIKIKPNSSVKFLIDGHLLFGSSLG